MAKKEYTPKDVEKIMLLAQGTISLNEQVYGSEFGEEPVELITLIPDDGPSVEELCFEEDKKNILHEFISKYLKPKEQTVLRLRYGLDDGQERTLEQIGIELGLTRERVRQLEQNGLRKLRFRFSYNNIRPEDMR